ncbi:alpha/beta hydrolase [Anaerotruncus sp. AF02-27]|jgi:non-heme chloroperoxidase|nr:MULTISPECIES: alpha/beta hydrolase [Anaerotruncus]RGX54815.1 alpha/beta hydrolase [Anaerotruncus sp. AF02-27]
MIYVKSTDGVKIATYDLNPKGNETVFLVHGWPLSHKMYEYQEQLLVNRGYRVVEIDLRGFGASDVPADGYNYDRMAEDIYNVVCALKLKSFVLVGFSMGGAIVLRYMRRFHGYGVKKLILLAAAAPSWTQRPGFPYGLSREYVNGLIEQAASDRPQLAHTFSHEQLFASPQSEAVKDWFEDISLSASGIGTVSAAVALRDEDGRQDLAFVKVPTVIIHGAKDVVVSSELARAQHAGIAGSRLCTLADSGHGIVYDELCRFNQVFLEALR